MKLLFILLLILSSIQADWVDDQLELKLPPIPEYEQPQEEEKEYYPTQTEPAPGVMYDYRTPSYDIYKYELAPQD